MIDDEMFNDTEEAILQEDPPEEEKESIESMMDDNSDKELGAVQWDDHRRE
jgi:hypothetical protein